MSIPIEEMSEKAFDEMLRRKAELGEEMDERILNELLKRVARLNKEIEELLPDMPKMETPISIVIIRQNERGLHISTKGAANFGTIVTTLLEVMVDKGMIMVVPSPELMRDVLNKSINKGFHA